MECPKYKYSHQKIKCYDKGIYVNSTSTYEYVPEKNVYRLIKRTCNFNEDYSNKHRCSGRTKFQENCLLINPPLIEVSPEDLESAQHKFLID